MQVIYLSSFIQVFSEVLKIILSFPTPEAVVKWAFCLCFPPTSLSWYGHQASPSNMVAMWLEFNALTNHICYYFAAGLSNFSPLQYTWNPAQNLPVKLKVHLPTLPILSHFSSLNSSLDPSSDAPCSPFHSQLIWWKWGKCTNMAWGDNLWAGSWEMSRSSTGKDKGKSIPKWGKTI